MQHCQRSTQLSNGNYLTALARREPIGCLDSDTCRLRLREEAVADTQCSHAGDDKETDSTQEEGQGGHPVARLVPCSLRARPKPPVLIGVTVGEVGGLGRQRAPTSTYPPCCRHPADFLSVLALLRPPQPSARRPKRTGRRVRRRRRSKQRKRSDRQISRPSLRPRRLQRPRRARRATPPRLLLQLVRRR